MVGSRVVRLGMSGVVERCRLWGEGRFWFIPGGVAFPDPSSGACRVPGVFLCRPPSGFLFPDSACPFGALVCLPVA